MYDLTGLRAGQVSGIKSDWSSNHELDFLPVVYPGFSWHNLHGEQLDAIPRRKGEFLWSQMAAAKRVGSEMIYVAMFDEVDEGTAIIRAKLSAPLPKHLRLLDRNRVG